MASIHDFQRWKREGKPFATLTAYDAPTARILAAAGIPLLLVGDSVGNTVLGYKNTVPVTMEEMLHHAKAVRRGAPDVFLVADMPFGSFQVTDDETVRNATRFLKEAGADAVKLEGGSARVSAVKRLIAAGIPVVGHLGLTPQSATILGGLKVQGRDAKAAALLVSEAKALEEAGCFSIVLECVPEQVAKAVTEALDVPTIGIGAGAQCDGQILVVNDLLGIEGGYRARFVRRYADLDEIIAGAVERYADDVRNRSFPAEGERFSMSSKERELFEENRK